jgi:hypothetical protein
MAVGARILAAKQAIVTRLAAIDLAVLGGMPPSASLNQFQVLKFQPFDPVHKRTEAAVRGPDGRVFRVAKGAPQVILATAENAGESAAPVHEAVNRFAARRLEGDHRQSAPDGHRRQNGHRRPGRHRQGNRRAIRHGSEHSGSRQPQPRQAFRFNDAVKVAAYRVFEGQMGLLARLHRRMAAFHY